MPNEITPAEGGGLVGAVVLIFGAVAQNLRLSARIETVRAQAQAAEERAATVERLLADAIETLEERYNEALRRSRSEFASSPRISRSGLVEEVVREIVRGHLRDLEMRLDALTERVGDVVRLVRLLVGEHEPPPPTKRRSRPG